MSQTTQTLLVAFAAADAATLPDAHFGEAPGFALYRVTAESAEFVGVVPNTVRHAHAEGEGRHHHEQHGHGDEHKGQGIGRLLADHDVQVIVSRAFGPNITRIRQKFLPVVVHLHTVDEALRRLQQDWERVAASWNAGAERKHLVLR